MKLPDLKGLFIPEEIMAMPDISLSEKVILARICFRARITGVCIDTNDEIGDAVMIHGITVSKSVNMLVAIDCLTRTTSGTRRHLRPSLALRQLFFDVYADSVSTETTTIPTLGPYAEFCYSVQEGKQFANHDDSNGVASTLTNSLPLLSYSLSEPKQFANAALAHRLATQYIRSNIKLKNFKKDARYEGKQNAKGKKSKKQPENPPAETPHVPQAAAPPLPPKPPYPPFPPADIVEPEPDEVVVEEAAPDTERFTVDWARTTMRPDGDDEVRERLRYWQGMLVTDDSFLATLEKQYPAIPGRAKLIEYIVRFIREVSMAPRMHKHYADCKDNLSRWMSNREKDHTKPSHDRTQQTRNTKNHGLPASRTIPGRHPTSPGRTVSDKNPRF